MEGGGGAHRERRWILYVKAEFDTQNDPLVPRKALPPRNARSIHVDRSRAELGTGSRHGRELPLGFPGSTHWPLHTFAHAGPWPGMPFCLTCQNPALLSRLYSDSMTPGRLFWVPQLDEILPLEQSGTLCSLLPPPPIRVGKPAFHIRQSLLRGEGLSNSLGSQGT